MGGRGLWAWGRGGACGGAGGWKGEELPLEAAPALCPEARRALSGPSRAAPRSQRAPACRGRADGARGPARPRRALFLFHFPSFWAGALAGEERRRPRGRYWAGLRVAEGPGVRPPPHCPPKFAPGAGASPPGTCSGWPLGEPGAPPGGGGAAGRGVGASQPRPPLGGGEGGGLRTHGPWRGGASAPAQPGPAHLPVGRGGLELRAPGTVLHGPARDAEKFPPSRSLHALASFNRLGDRTLAFHHSTPWSGHAFPLSEDFLLTFGVSGQT